MCKVSVIIPAYNSEAFIERTIRSVLNQTFSDFELIIIDDCSSDNTLSVCKEIAKGDKRVKIIESSMNAGPSKARNRGLGIARGEFISFVDSDDTLDSDFLRILVGVAEDFCCDIVWCNYIEVMSDAIVERKHGLQCNEVLDSKYAMSLFFAPQIGLASLCNKLYRKEFINCHKLSINEQRFHGEDWEFNFYLFTHKPRIVLVEDLLYYYNRVNTASVVSSYHETDFDFFIKSNQLAAEIAEKWGLEYDVKHINGKLVYNAISMLRKLVHSSISDKKDKWNTIVQNKYLGRIISSNDFYKELLPKRYKIYLLLIKHRMSFLAEWMMRNE